MIFREDLGRQDLTPLVTSCFLGCATTKEAWTVGGETVILGFKIGVGK